MIFSLYNTVWDIGTTPSIRELSYLNVETLLSRFGALFRL